MSDTDKSNALRVTGCFSKIHVHQMQAFNAARLVTNIDDPSMLSDEDGNTQASLLIVIYLLGVYLWRRKLIFICLTIYAVAAEQRGRTHRHRVLLRSSNVARDKLDLNQVEQQTAFLYPIGRIHLPIAYRIINDGPFIGKRPLTSFLQPLSLNVCDASLATAAVSCCSSTGLYCLLFAWKSGELQECIYSCRKPMATHVRCWQLRQPMKMCTKSRHQHCFTIDADKEQLWRFPEMTFTKSVPTRITVIAHTRQEKVRPVVVIWLHLKLLISQLTPAVISMLMTCLTWLSEQVLQHSRPRCRDAQA